MMLANPLTTEELEDIRKDPVIEVPIDRMKPLRDVRSEVCTSHG